MKKIILLLVILMIAGYTSNAQKVNYYFFKMHVDVTADDICLDATGKITTYIIKSKKNNNHTPNTATQSPLYEGPGTYYFEYQIYDGWYVSYYSSTINAIAYVGSGQNTSQIECSDFQDGELGIHDPAEVWIDSHLESDDNNTTPPDAGGD